MPMLTLVLRRGGIMGVCTCARQAERKVMVYRERRAGIAIDGLVLLG